MKVRFVHAADLHLDAPFAGLRDVEPTIADRLRDATLQAFDGVVNLSLAERVDFVVFAGDLFDGEHRGLRAQIRFASGLGRLAADGIPVLVAHGNHDPWEDWSPRLTWPEGVQRFGCREVEGALVARDGQPLCRAYGISFERREETRNLARLFAPEPDAPFTIGVLHTHVGGGPAESGYAPCGIEDLIAVRLDYWALGHIHTRQVLRDADPCIVYPGNTQGLNPNETGPRGCTLVTLESGRPPAPEARRTGPAEWVQPVLSIDGLPTESELADAAEELIGEAQRQTEADLLLVRLRFTGSGPLHSVVSRAEARDELAGLLRDRLAGRAPAVWLESIRDETRTAIDLATCVAGDDFLAEYLREADRALADPGALDALREDEELAKLLAHREVGRTLALTEGDLRRWIEAARVLGAERLLGEGASA